MKKSSIRAKIEAGKHLHAVFLLTAEQRHWCHDVADVQSDFREPWFILASLNVMWRLLTSYADTDVLQTLCVDSNINIWARKRYMQLKKNKFSCSIVSLDICHSITDTIFKQFAQISLFYPQFKQCRSNLIILSTIQAIRSNLIILSTIQAMSLKFDYFITIQAMSLKLDFFYPQFYFL